MPNNDEIQGIVDREYQYGSVTDIDIDTDIDADEIPPGLNEDIIRMISAKKDEPEFLCAGNEPERQLHL